MMKFAPELSKTSQREPLKDLRFEILDDWSLLPKEAIPADDALPLPETVFADSERGIWLFNGNSLEIMDAVAEKHPNGCFDVIFADPPRFRSPRNWRSHHSGAKEIVRPILQHERHGNGIGAFHCGAHRGEARGIARISNPPKDKTLELFGTPDKKVKKGFRPFHEYSMRQAIAEGFILDVLQSYTTYKTYFELVQNEKAEGEKLVEELKARRLLLEYVDQHAFAIKRKAHIIVDHFTRKTAHKIGSQAKAMVVTHSRAHAVLYQQAIAEILREQNLPFGLLVAFSGTVTINEQKYTEVNMNPPGTGDIAEAFKNPAQRLLVVANKFQTGFDQPLLHTMYVDKKLGGVAAVQTLSRLNRILPPLKLDTLVLDFVNEQEVIQASFQDYYQRTDLEGATDPNKLYNLKYTLEQMHVFAADDVEQFAQLFIVQKVTSDKLQPFFQRIVDTGYANLGSEHKGQKDFEKLAAEAKEKFRKETARYVRQYSFISQIMTFTDAKLEKFYLFAKLLLKQLPFERVTLPREVMDMVDMDKYRVQEERNGSIALAEEDATLDVTQDDGHRGKSEEDKERLKIVVQKLNEDYGIAFDDADRVISALKDALEKDDDLKAAMRSNSIEDLKKRKLKDSIQDALMNNADDNLTFRFIREVCT